MAPVSIKTEFIKHVFQEGRSVFRPHAGPRRKSHRLRGDVHVRSNTAAAVSHRNARWALSGVWRRVGYAFEGEAVSAGITYIRTASSNREIPSTGRVSTRTGITSVLGVIRQICRRTTMPRARRSRPLGRRSTSVANRVTAPRPITYPGRRAPEQPGDGKGFAVRFDERKQSNWVMGEDGQAHRSAPRTTAKEIEVCARCHGRRQQFSSSADSMRSLLDAFRPSMIEPGPLSYRWSAARRGLRLCLVRPEQDVCSRRHLFGLP